jgi:hypothetical protein
LFAAESAGYTAVSADRNTDISTANKQSGALLGITKKDDIRGRSGEQVTVAELKNNLDHQITNIDIEVEVHEEGTIFDGFSIESQSDNVRPISDINVSDSISSDTQFSLKGTLVCDSRSEKTVNLSLTASTRNQEIQVEIGEFKLTIECVTFCDPPPDCAKYMDTVNGNSVSFDGDNCRTVVITNGGTINGNRLENVETLYLQTDATVNGGIKENSVDSVYMCDGVTINGGLSAGTVYGASNSRVTINGDKNYDEGNCIPKCNSQPGHSEQ